MTESKAVHSTFVVERNFNKPVEKVFAAFSDLDKVRRWYGEGEGHDVEEFRSDFKVGGEQMLRYKLKAGTPVAGMTIRNEGRFQEIQPNARIVLASTMDLNDTRILVGIATIELSEHTGKTALVLTHQGVYLSEGLTPGMIEAGWKSLLEKLAAELDRQR